MTEPGRAWTVSTVLGPALKQIRRQKKYSLREVAERTGLHLNSIWRYERGEFTVDLDTYAMLCQVLDVSPTLLLRDVLRRSSPIPVKTKETLMKAEETGISNMQKDA